MIHVMEMMMSVSVVIDVKLEIFEFECFLFSSLMNTTRLSVGDGDVDTSKYF